MLALGIDVSKATLHLALLMPGDKLRHQTCATSAAGFHERTTWLTRHTPDAGHACLEATGSYGDAIALFLYEAGHTVSVVNPSILAAYAKAQLLRAKADPVDAAM